MATTLEEARSRIEHVVVLMLENRSFDHLLGFLDVPGSTPPGDEHANPDFSADPASGGARVSPTADANYLLELDPPHSHASVRLQMGTPRAGRYPMDGFVEAYRLKLLNREHLPTIHWHRIRKLALGASPFVVAAVGLLLSRLLAGDWLRLIVWNLPAVALLAAVVLPMARAADVSRTRVVAGVVAGGLAVASGIEGVVRFVAGPTWVGGPLVAAAATAAFVWVRRMESSAAAKRRPLEGDAEREAEARAPEVMRCIPAVRLPVLGTLAREFTTCTRWFSSVPGATWPNRNFVHAGTSSQAVDNEIGFYHDKTVFELLDDQHAAGRGPATLTTPPWKIYRDGMPQVLAFENLWQPNYKDRWAGMGDFKADCEAGRLPTYSFLEPRHSDGNTNSMHPGNNERASDGSSDFARGEQLVWDVYEALRGGGDLFDRTLLVITFDEHGGLFDRESPPRTVHPEGAAAVRHPLLSTRRLVAWFVENRNAPFDFRRLGPRVPTIVISPRVARGVDRRVYDHTSVIATVRELFAPDQPTLGRRAARANTFWHLISGSTPRPMPDLPVALAGQSDLAADEAVASTDVSARQWAPPEAEVFPEVPPESAGHARESDDLAEQLVTIALKAEERLDRLGAPPADEDPTRAASPLEKADDRLKRWASTDR